MRRERTSHDRETMAVMVAILKAEIFQSRSARPGDARPPVAASLEAKKDAHEQEHAETA